MSKELKQTALGAEIWGQYRDKVQLSIKVVNEEIAPKLNDLMNKKIDNYNKNELQPVSKLLINTFITKEKERADLYNKNKEIIDELDKLHFESKNIAHKIGLNDSEFEYAAGIISEDKDPTDFLLSIANQNVDLIGDQNYS